MGSKFSKSSKAEKKWDELKVNGKALPENFDKTSTLPASFRRRDEEVIMTGTLPRNLNRNQSFSKRFRKSCKNWAAQRGLIDPCKAKQTETQSQVPTKPSSVVLAQEECKDKITDVAQEVPEVVITKAQSLDMLVEKNTMPLETPSIEDSVNTDSVAKCENEALATSAEAEIVIETPLKESDGSDLIKDCFTSHPEPTNNEELIKMEAEKSAEIIIEAEDIQGEQVEVEKEKTPELFTPIIEVGILKEDEIKKCDLVDEPETQILINEKEQAVEIPIIESTTQTNESENYGEKEETSKIIEPEMIEVDKEEVAEKNVIVQEVLPKDVISEENKITAATFNIQENLVESEQSIVEEITLEENKTTEETSSIQESLVESEESIVEEVLAKDITLEENKATEETPSIQENLVESEESIVEEVLAKDITSEEKKTTEETPSIEENLVESEQSIVEEVLTKDITSEINKTTEETSSIQENLVESEQSVVEEVIAKDSSLEENKTTDEGTVMQENLVEPELKTLGEVIAKDITIEENKTTKETILDNCVEADKNTLDVETNIIIEREEKEVGEDTSMEKNDVEVIENIIPSETLAEAEKEVETTEDSRDKDDDIKEETNAIHGAIEEVVVMEVNQVDIEKSTENTDTESTINKEVSVEEIDKDEINLNESRKTPEIIDDNKTVVEDEVSIENEEVTFTKDDNAEAVECSQIQTEELETISKGNISANNNSEVMENDKCNEVSSEKFEDETVDKEEDNNLNESGNLIVESKTTSEIEESITVEHLEQSISEAEICESKTNVEEDVICTKSETNIEEAEQEEEIEEDIGSTEVKVEKIIEEKQIENEVDATKNEEVPKVENILDISDGVWKCQWNLSCIDSKKEEADLPMTMQTPDAEEIAVEETTEELQPQFELSKEEEMDDKNGQISELSSFDSINTVIQRTDNQLESLQDIETQDENDTLKEETDIDNKLEAGECENIAEMEDETTTALPELEEVKIKTDVASDVFDNGEPSSLESLEEEKNDEITAGNKTAETAVQDIITDIVDNIPSQNDMPSLENVCESPADDLVSEGGSDGCVSTDEGIAASDDDDKDSCKSGELKKDNAKEVSESEIQIESLITEIDQHS